MNEANDQSNGPVLPQTALTRRDVLQRAGWAIAAATLPAVPQAAAMAQARSPVQSTSDDAHGVSEITNRLASYMSAAGDRELPNHVLEQAKWHILDTIAAMVSGSELPPGRVAIKFARGYGGEKVATVVGDTIVCGPLEAALANGVLAHADETDDSWPGGWHPGCGIVPAALATGERFGISGARFVRAVALGYDVGARVLIAIRAGLTETAQGDPRGGRHLGRRGGRRERRAPAARRKCGGCSTTRPSSVQASRPGSVTPTISRRDSSTEECQRGAA